MKNYYYLFLFLLVGCSKTHENMPPLKIVKGVSQEIAAYRKLNIDNIHYQLFFSIPESKHAAIAASLSVDFTLKSLQEPLLLDFNVATENVLKISKDNKEIPFVHENEHLVIASEHLHIGQNALVIEFMAGELSLNRQEAFLYTLFVPDRASTAFPAFDQPDLKARYSLTLEVPETWEALTNAPQKGVQVVNGRKTISFLKSDAISTYLFAFTAGEFQKISAQRNGRNMTMYYRENDKEKVQRNTQAIFDLHGKSLRWLEEYTQIPYPFQKFDFALIPSFQYGGMEHPGAIFYRESTLFLDESATLSDELSRASLIAHETAHIWFGDLVTMKWFDDVWSKEVFANFMADKIVNPFFPNINHPLKFMLRHHPSAYAVDRSKGANAIRQQLGNLKEAGLMYGPIIYQKAPIMMKHLEQLSGEDAFRDGLREYLKTYAFDNADWNDLIALLDPKTPSDLDEWSAAWIEEPGMPIYKTSLTQTQNGLSLALKQYDSMDRNRVWMQQLTPTVYASDKEASQSVLLESNSMTTHFSNNAADFVFTNGAGTEYGAFILDDASIAYLLENISEVNDVFQQGKLWLSLYESLLAGKTKPKDYLQTLQGAIPQTTDLQLLDSLLEHYRTIYWRFLSPLQRADLAPRSEQILHKILVGDASTSIKTSVFKTYVNTFYSQQSKQLIEQIWKQQKNDFGITLSENDHTSLAMQLALRDVPNAEAIINQQIERIKNPNRKQRLQFLKPVLSHDELARDAFFESLSKLENRAIEPWVQEGLRFLHHPLRANNSIKYIRPSLALLEEIQLTGDIFFPAGWINATFSGHQSAQAVDVANTFLVDNPDYNPKLKQKILQATDMVERASAIVE
jgi:aminopeptidase N